MNNITSEIDELQALLSQLEGRIMKASDAQCTEIVQLLTEYRLCREREPNQPLATRVQLTRGLLLHIREVMEWKQ